MKKISLLTLPEQKNRSNSVKIKNLRVSTTHRISLSNYNSNIIKEKIRKIHQTMASYHMKNLIRTNELVSNTQKSLSKKNLILSLREDLEYHKKINENYKSYEKYADDLCKCYKKNFDDIFIYKKDLTEDLKDFIKMLKDFEVDEKDLINQKRMIKQSNEDIIKYKLEEQINLNKKIIKLNQDLEKQSITLKDLNAILKSNLSMNQNNLINLQNEELKYKDKLEMLENAYKKLIYRYNYYQNLITLETKRKFINENSNIDETNEASIKLKEETIKNNYLKKEINAMKNKMKEIDEMNTSRQRKFKYKINKDNKDITTEVKTTMSKFSDTKLNFTSNFLNP